MNYSAGSFTVVAPGQIQITGLLFPPKFIQLRLGERTGVTENTQARFGFGSADGVSQSAIATLSNANGFFTRNYSQYCIAGLTTPGGGINRSISGILTAFTLNGFIINFDKCDDIFRVYVDVYG